MKLLKHQEQAINACNDNDNGTINMFCGTGKTLTYINLMKNNSSIVLIPSLILMRELYRQLKIHDIDNILLCNHVSNWRKKITNKQYQHIICTYNSAEELHKYIRDHVYSTLICDESQRMCNMRGFRILKLYSSMTDKEFLFTGTPQRELCQKYNAQIIFTYSFYQAMQDKIITDFNLWTLKPDILHIIDAIRESKSKNIIIYCHNYYIGNIHCGTLLQNYLNEKHDIEAKYVRYDDKDKYDKIEWFQIPGKHVKKIMINVNLLQEGFDNKYVDSIIFMNSEQSFTKTIQNLGRSLRINGDKIPNIYVMTDDCASSSTYKILQDLKDKKTITYGLK